MNLIFRDSGHSADVKTLASKLLAIQTFNTNDVLFTIVLFQEPEQHTGRDKSGAKSSGKHCSNVFMSYMNKISCSSNISISICKSHIC